MRLRHSILSGLALVALLSLAASTASAALFGYSCIINQAQEVPASGSAALGSGSFVYNDATGNLAYTIQYNGITSGVTVAHIHGPAAAGVNAGVQFGLSPLVGSTFGTMIGTWAAVSAANVANLNAGLLYVNIHSNTFPGGEIRGQIYPDQATPTLGSTWGKIKSLYR